MLQIQAHNTGPPPLPAVMRLIIQYSEVALFARDAFLKTSRNSILILP